MPHYHPEFHDHPGHLDNVLCVGINTSMIISAIGQGPEASFQFFKLHWQDFLLQYIGVLTTGVFGLLLAFILPLIGKHNLRDHIKWCKRGWG